MPSMPFALLGKAGSVGCQNRMRFQEDALKLVPLVAFAICMAGCQRVPTSRLPTFASPTEGLAFAQASCGGCHAVDRYGASPNPNAPPFAGVVNQPGLTAETLSSWLRDAHNYPEEMEFYLQRREVDDLVAYMTTLRDVNYRPPI